MSIVRALYELVFVRVYIIVFCIRFVSSFADACRYLIVFWHLYPFLPLLVCMHNDWLMSQVSCSMSSLMLCKKKKNWKLEWKRRYSPWCLVIHPLEFCENLFLFGYAQKLQSRFIFSPFEMLYNWVNYFGRLNDYPHAMPLHNEEIGKQINYVRCWFCNLSGPIQTEN